MIDYVFSLGSPEFWALTNSLVYSITITLVRRGMATGTPLASIIILNSSVAAAGLCTGFLRGTLTSAEPGALLWFALTGMVGFGAGRLLYFFAIQNLGVSRATVIQSATPLWSVIFAMVALGERPSSAVLLGTISIVGGICLLSWPEKKEKAGFRSWIQQGIYLPLISSVLYALVPIFGKLGLSYQQAPYMGFGVAFGSSLLVILATRPLTPGGGKIRADRKAIWFFFLGAPTNILAAFSMWTALSRGMVSRVLPLSRMTPLWVLLFSYLFLGRYERIRSRTVIAAIFVVAGGVLITLFR